MLHDDFWDICRSRVGQVLFQRFCRRKRPAHGVCSIVIPLSMSQPPAPFFLAKYPLLFLLLSSLLLATCDTGDEPVPAYLNLGDFEVQATNASVHGSVSHKITHAKVFLRNLATTETHSLGALALPGTYPVLLQGDFELNVDPVIKANGNSFSAVIYPFYNRYTTTVNLIPAEDTPVAPVTTYIADAKFEFIENFEAPTHLFVNDRDENPLTAIVRSGADVFEGSHSGYAHLDTANPVLVVSTKSPFPLNTAQQSRIFMEVNYKTDLPLEFGLIAVDAQGVEEANFAFSVFAKAEWNKIYFDLTELISTARAEQFFIVLRSFFLPGDAEEFPDGANIWIDNVKVVHF